MRYLNVGTDRKISKIGLGTWQFGSREWGYGERYANREAHAIVRRAVGLGVTLFDTAEIYGSGRSERILGRALGEDRESVFLATKLVPVVPSALAVKRRAAASAKRLGVARLDLYQVHWPNPLVPDSTIMRGMRSLQGSGLVGEVGVSNYSLERWRAAEEHLRSRVLCNQVPYSLVDRSPERDLLPFAAAHGHVVIAFSPLAQGLLSGRYHGAGLPGNDIRATSPLFRPENLERTSDLIATLREVADAHAATPAQIALAWAIHHPAVAAIPGAGKQRRGRRDRTRRRRVPGAGQGISRVRPGHSAGRARSPQSVRAGALGQERMVPGQDGMARPAPTVDQAGLAGRCCIAAACSVLIFKRLRTQAKRPSMDVHGHGGDRSEVSTADARNVPASPRRPYGTTQAA
jgi:aryl-alcohol dehydrogenase-like predicted oxidoreductase